MKKAFLLSGTILVMCCCNAAIATDNFTSDSLRLYLCEKRNFWYTDEPTTKTYRQLLEEEDVEEVGVAELDIDDDGTSEVLITDRSCCETGRDPGRFIVYVNRKPGIDVYKVAATDGDSTQPESQVPIELTENTHISTNCDETSKGLVVWYNRGRSDEGTHLSIVLYSLHEKRLLMRDVCQGVSVSENDVTDEPTTEPATEKTPAELVIDCLVTGRGILPLDDDNDRLSVKWLRLDDLSTETLNCP